MYIRFVEFTIIEIITITFRLHIFLQTVGLHSRSAQNINVAAIFDADSEPRYFDETSFLEQTF